MGKHFSNITAEAVAASCAEPAFKFPSAMVALRGHAATSIPEYTPYGNTECIPGHGIQSSEIPNEKGIPTSAKAGNSASTLPQNTPPKRGRVRKSRAIRTSAAMADFLGKFGFDWLSVTMTNVETGKGEKAEDESAEGQERKALMTLTLWARSQGLYRIKIGNGTDGFPAAAHLGLTPVDRDRVATIRSGHSKTMPGLEIPGGDGACAHLAPSALALLGPVLVSRADAKLDVSHPGLFDDLLQLAIEMVGTGAGQGMSPPELTDRGEGRTFLFGGKDVAVKVYEKDLERVAKGKLDPTQADGNLVRIEFIFRPDTKRKAAFSKMTPGQMIQSSRWARRFAERLAQLIGAAGNEDRIAEIRRREIPDASTVKQRAARVIKMSAKTTVSAAAKIMVDEDFGGDWEAARGQLDPDDLRTRARDLFEQQLAELRTAEYFIENAGLDKVRTDEERAAIMADELDDYTHRLRWERDASQELLDLALDAAAVPKVDAEAEAASESDPGQRDQS